MAEKNITMRQLGNDGTYDNLYPQTSATQSKLSADTQKLFGQDNVDASLDKLADTLQSIGRITVKVVDANNNPIENVTIQGISGNPKTNSSGIASGISTRDTITAVSPYVDIANTTVDAKDYIGSASILTVSLSQSVAENTVIRYTSSTSIMFSDAVSTIDVCCVGGGGGGANYIIYQSGSNYIRSYTNPGGGGGGIVSSFGLTVNANTVYSIVIGQGGVAGSAGGTNGSGSTGGTSSFAGVSAAGGGGGIAERVSVSGQYTRTMAAGTAGVVGCGDGGYAGGNGSDANPGNANTTVSEFNDGVTFYSGGGGAGSTSFNEMKAGGSPNGASGSYWYNRAIGAGSAGIGGGGGGGMLYYQYNAQQYYTGYASKGGSGLVAIRLHF